LSLSFFRRVALRRDLLHDSGFTSLFRAAMVALLFSLAGLVLSLYLYNLSGGYLYDDAYITFRYARNFARGQGLVFQPGSRVLGTTAPFYAVILGFLSRLSGADTPLLSVLLSGACLGLASGLLVLCFPSPRRWIRLFAALFILFNPLLWKLSATGMETGLFLLLLTVALVVRSPPLAALWGASSAFVRPEGALFSIALLALDRSSSVKSRLLAALILAVSFAVPLSFIAREYGSPLPHSIFAKAIFFATVFPTGHQSRAFLESLLFAGFWRRVFFLLFVAGTLLLFRRPERWKWLSFPLLASAIFLFLYAMNFPVFPWYVAPLAFTAVLMSFIVADAIVEGLKSRGVAFGGCLLLPPIFVIGGLLTLSADRKVVSELTLAQSTQVSTTGAVAQWLSSYAHKDESILLPEIGLIAYVTELRILDWGGIVSPELSPFIARNDLLGALKTFSPDYLLYMLPRSESSPFQSAEEREWFANRYLVVERFPRAPPLGDYVLFRRSDPSDSPAFAPGRFPARKEGSPAP
jgi:arabinofuranosyltransferase